MGSYCPAHEARQKQRRTEEERRRPSAHQRGYGPKWRKASKGFLAKHPICEYCQQAQATLVDHRIPHKGDMSLFWDRANWAPSCATCHSRKTAAEDGGFGNASKTRR